MRLSCFLLALLLELLLLQEQVSLQLFQLLLLLQEEGILALFLFDLRLDQHRMLLLELQLGQLLLSLLISFFLPEPPIFNFTALPLLGFSQQQILSLLLLARLLLHLEHRRHAFLHFLPEAVSIFFLAIEQILLELLLLVHELLNPVLLPLDLALLSSLFLLNSLVVLLPQLLNLSLSLTLLFLLDLAGDLLDLGLLATFEL
mmetsp:Transcript_4461/g.6614  ORF Transcript_4461/g.6614 Transcript_4461/m.6614 type:complete len:202 (-) Transcript_4461:2600-3205(-)